MSSVPLLLCIGFLVQCREPSRVGGGIACDGVGVSGRRGPEALGSFCLGKDGPLKRPWARLLPRRAVWGRRRVPALGRDRWRLMLVDGVCDGGGGHSGFAGCAFFFPFPLGAAGLCAPFGFRDSSKFWACPFPMFCLL